MSASNGGNSITLKGANETVLYLKNFERDIYGVLAKEVKEILKRTQAGAKAKYPGGQWAVRFGVAGKNPIGQVTTTGGSSREYKSWAEAPAGVRASIFDTYGRKTSPSSMKTPQARATGESLMSRYGRPQRFLWPAWLGVRDESMKAIEDAFKRAEDSLQAKMGA